MNVCWLICFSHCENASYIAFHQHLFHLTIINAFCHTKSRQKFNSCHNYSHIWLKYNLTRYQNYSTYWLIQAGCAQSSVQNWKASYVFMEWIVLTAQIHARFPISQLMHTNVSIHENTSFKNIQVIQMIQS